MKYLIILLICSGLFSCKFTETHENDVITSVSISNTGCYVYNTTKGIVHSHRLIYNVGDTIKFTK